jgi:hypothetical protein
MQIDALAVYDLSNYCTLAHATPNLCCICFKRAVIMTTVHIDLFMPHCPDHLIYPYPTHLIICHCQCNRSDRQGLGQGTDERHIHIRTLAVRGEACLYANGYPQDTPPSKVLWWQQEDSGRHRDVIACENEGGSGIVMIITTALQFIVLGVTGVRGTRL